MKNLATSFQAVIAAFSLFAQAPQAFKYQMVVSGDFTTIDWGTDSFFLQIEMDETGGNIDRYYKILEKMRCRVVNLLNTFEPFYGLIA